MPKLYRENGLWVVPGQQGKKAERVDIPSTPAELAAWLNVREQQQEIAPEVEQPPVPQNGSVACPRCKMLPGLAERSAKALAERAITEERIRWIAEEADPGTLGRLAAAVAERFNNLK